LLRPPSGQGKLAHWLPQRQATEEALLAAPPLRARQAGPTCCGSAKRPRRRRWLCRSGRGKPRPYKAARGIDEETTTH